MDNTGETEETKMGLMESLVKRINTTECMRNTLLTGFYGAFIGGVGTYLYTNNLKKTSKASYISYWVVAWSYWFLCRVSNHNMRMAIKAIQKLKRTPPEQIDGYYVPNAVLTEPTEDDALVR